MDTTSDITVKSTETGDTTLGKQNLLYKHVLDKFEYQVQLQFHICIELMINYKYPNEF